MSWPTLLAILTDLAGPEIAAEFDVRARYELQGERVTVGARQAVTAEEAEAAAPGRVAEAAKRLGVHRTTVYRALKRGTVIR